MKAARSSSRVTTTLLSAAVLSVGGCLGVAKFHDISDDHQAALHGVHAQRLTQRMEKINKEYRRVHRLPIRTMRAREFRNVEHCADLIAGYAAELPTLVDISQFDQNDQVIFRELAGRLKTHAEALKASAAEQNRPMVQKMFRKLTSTCNACHAAFRQPIDDH